MKTQQSLLPLLFLGALAWFGIGKYRDFSAQRRAEREALVAEKEEGARQKRNREIMQRSLDDARLQAAARESERVAAEDAKLPKVRVKLRDAITIQGGRVEQSEMLTQSQYEHWVKNGKKMSGGRPSLRQ